VFTWHGCTIELDGVSEVAYVADEVNLSSLFERLQNHDLSTEQSYLYDGPSSIYIDFKK
jgi:hypothetical protein